MGMKISRKMAGLSTIVAVLAFTALSLAQTAKLIPMRDFFKNPEKAYFQISPDGNYISFTQPYQSRMNIFVQARGSSEAKRVTSITDRDISQYFWKGNNRLLYLKDFGGDENFHLYAVNVDSAKETDLTPFEGVRVQVVDALRDHDTDMIVMMNKRNQEIFDVYRLNTVTGNILMVAENPGNITGWYTDHDGKIRLASTTDGVNTSILYRQSEIDTFKVILTTNFKETFSPLFFTFDNKQVYATSNIGRDKSVIVRYDPSTAKEVEVIYQDPNYDVDQLSYSKARKVLTDVQYTTWKPIKKYLDKETEEVYSKLEKRLPGYDVYLTFSDKSENAFICRTMNDRTLGTYYLYEKAGDKLTKLADRSPWLKEDDLCEMKPISYKSRDGLTINGYLTLPKGREAKSLPAIVYPHGGPWARDVWGFNPEIQFLANRGYAVFQMDFRGSTGYGRAFWEASFKQWGKTMQDDITDGVNWLIKEGIADPKRIAIYGISYGGYATLAGVAFTPDLYTCAIDYCGVANIFTVLRTIPPYWKPQLAMFYEMMGDPEKDSILLAEVSPVFHADKIRVPMLIAQGAKDPRVNIVQTNEMVDALKKRGVEVEYIVKENEGHGFDNEENRFDLYEAMEKFLAKHLPN
jgi:dipeptidyl aminopeptidase/acylaminoacyl peptidase